MRCEMRKIPGEVMVIVTWVRMGHDRKSENQGGGTESEAE
jgi:hypothetical protein